MEWELIYLKSCFFLRSIKYEPVKATDNRHPPEYARVILLLTGNAVKALVLMGEIST